MLDLKGMRYVVFGVASNRSLAWAITKKLVVSGAQVQVVCQDAVRERVFKLTQELSLPAPLTYDAQEAGSADLCFASLAQSGPWHGIVHSIAHADSNELAGRFLDTSLPNFLMTMQISCFSFVDIARRAEAILEKGGSILTLTFDASRGFYPHYNVMSLAKAALETAVMYAAADLGEKEIRVNAVSASPADTPAARGISNFRLIGAFAAALALLGRRATPEEIANEAAYLLSPLSSGVTGQVRFVDCGSSVSTMPPARNAGMMADAMAKVWEIVQRPRT